MAAAPEHNTTMDAPVYTKEQIDAYIKRIHLSHYNRDQYDDFTFLTNIVRNQVIHVPFETLGLHYSKDRTISLDPAALFDKIVRRRRGGYCLENNTFFGCMLRSLGFRVYGVICRISKATWGVHDGSWRPMSHMANIVILGDKKYLVDVGYGVDGPVCPVLLGHTGLYTNIIGQQIKLRSQTLPQHTDPSQKVWVYSQCRGNWDGPWQEVYHFADTEVLPQDFDVLNFYNMTNSLWARTVVAQHFIPIEDEDIQDIKGTRMLVGKELRMGDGSSSEHIVVERYKTEEDRLDALRLYFNIQLSDEETSAIIGRPTALTGSEP